MTAHVYHQVGCQTHEMARGSAVIEPTAMVTGAREAGLREGLGWLTCLVATWSCRKSCEAPCGPCKKVITRNNVHVSGAAGSEGGSRPPVKGGHMHPNNAAATSYGSHGVMRYTFFCQQVDTQDKAEPPSFPYCCFSSQTYL